METRDKATPEAIEACIARVLAAERDAQEAIVSAQARAGVAVTHARAAARAIAERAERRVAAASQSIDARIARHQAEADAQAQRMNRGLAPAEADDRRLDAALGRVAASLTAGRRP